MVVVNIRPEWRKPTTMRGRGPGGTYYEPIIFASKYARALEREIIYSPVW
jgi:hypothetical protein